MRTAAFLIILVCATSLSLPGQQETEEGTAATIRALEHEWVDAQARNDNRALDLIFDSALVYVEYGRLVPKWEYLSRIRTAAPQMNQIVMESVTVRVFGRTAVVVGTYRETQVKSGRRTLIRWRFIDTWAYKKNAWLLVAAAATPISK